MPRYYCDYCDTYLTHDSPSVRKQHNAGYKHKFIYCYVRQMYDPIISNLKSKQTQSLIDQRIKEHLGQAAAFQQQVGAAFNQHLLSMPGGMRGLVFQFYHHQFCRLEQLRQFQESDPCFADPNCWCSGLCCGSKRSNCSTPMVPPGATSMPMQMPSLPRPPTLTPPAS
uniref:Matrin-type domain-containing protein n=1 Tax=Ananas comosus var. bracteatus TaxID=296719 RepID=A0A6V7NQ31_ANACO|nr:unnamed protein product [Ananas comosus var. bracteatus]